LSKGCGESDFENKSKGTMIERICAIGDIHGRFDLLTDMVERQIKFNPKSDKIIILGDVIDRGPDSREVVYYLKHLKETYPNNIILLMGNHEDMAMAYITQKENATVEERLYSGLWKPNGGDATLRSFEGIGNCKNVLVPFINSLDLYHQEDDFIFVHAGLPRKLRDIKKIDRRDLIWERDLKYWGNLNLIVGHNIVARVTKVRKYTMIDTGAFMTGVLSAYDILSDKIYQAVDYTRPIKEKTNR
jgi:serine/threonine protein phosphatase 1